MGGPIAYGGLAKGESHGYEGSSGGVHGKPAILHDPAAEKAGFSETNLSGKSLHQTPASFLKLG